MRETKLKIFEEPRSQTKEEAIETLNLALKEANELLTPVEMAQEIMRVFTPSDVSKAITKLKIGKYVQ